MKRNYRNLLLIIALRSPFLFHTTKIFLNACFSIKILHQLFLTAKNESLRSKMRVWSLKIMHK